MAKHIGRDDLVRLPDPAGDDTHWVLQCDPFDWRIEQQTNEVEGILSELRVSQATGCSVHSRDRQVGTRWVCDHEVPSIIDDVHDITLVMRAGTVCREKVATQSFMAFGNKRIADCSAVFTSNQYFHKTPS